jgi:16S rRNA (guanine(966)-N(2))-methyltransferase RsmD
MGGVEGLEVADLFCGSGALGIEALSRGAASATFVDADPDALAAVRLNLTAVGLADHAATCRRASLPGWLGAAGLSVDLAFCDPPYDFDQWEALLGALCAKTAVVESPDAVVVPDGWSVTKSRRYGGTLVTVLDQAHSPRRPSPAGAW